MAMYEYETSPRKIETEYRPKKQNNKKTTNKNEDIKREIRQKAKENIKQRNAIIRRRRKLVVAIFFAFAILLAISYRNSLINESFAKVKTLKNELSTLEKENEQLQVSIESSVNIKNIEQAAQEKLGMQRLAQEQKVYINLPKKDYVEPATEKIKTEEDTSIFQKIIRFLKGE